MTAKTFQFDFNELKLTVDQIERVMGYRAGELDSTLHDVVERVMDQAGTVSDLKAEYRIFQDIKFDDASKNIEINGIVFRIGKIIYGQIKKSDAVALFACTAGGEIGERSRKAMRETNLLEGYIYDVIGSEAVEAAADLLQDEMEASMTVLEKKITNRFSPGYCGWDVAEQHKLFSLMPDNFCGIRLTPSALMEPVKSVSGIIGLGKNVRRMPYTCNLCDMKNCIYRRKA